MTASSMNTERGLFTIRHSTTSNEHLVFAETLRDWRDPLLQGQEPTPVLICPRCATCKCESLKDVHPSSINVTHHHHKHDPTCPNFRHQHERSKTAYKPRIIIKSKRRALSHDPSLIVLTNPSSIIKPQSTPSSHLTKREKPTSKIPVRIFTTPSPASSIIKIRSSNKKTKIPQSASIRNIILAKKLNNEELYEKDSLNGDVYQTMSDNENISPKKKKKDIKIINNINQLDNMDEQRVMKKKKTHKRSTTASPDKRQRRYQHKEGRQSESKAASNDLSSSSSSSSPASSSAVQLRKKSRHYRRASPSQPISSLSDDSLSEKTGDKQYHQRRAYSAVISTDQLHRTSPPSVYLIELTNKNNPINSYSLTKTLTYVWKNQIEEENDLYPRYTVEQISPILNQENRSIPLSSRNVILQRGQTDYWQNLETSSNSIITSSCQNSTGSASYLVSPFNDTESRKTPTNSKGHVISITTITRRQQSLLNQTKNIQWNIEGDGKQVRYSKNRSYSADQLDKHHHTTRKHRTKRAVDNNTDTGSSSEQNNQSVSLILQPENNSSVPTEIHEEKLPSATLSKQSDSNVPEYSSFHRNIINASSVIIRNEKGNHSSSTPSSRPMLTAESKHVLSASTDDDVDELNSHYSEGMDQSIGTGQSYRDKFNSRLSNEKSELNSDPTFRSRILSTEHSQLTTLDSGVDIITDQKIYQPNRTLTIDEQSSEEITDQIDLFALSDNSLIETEHKSTKHSLFNQSITEMTEMESFFSAKSEVQNEKDPYSGYQLEDITDEDEDYHVKEHTQGFILISESLQPILSTPPPPIPPQFELKLPSFSEWIDQAFTSFLSETNQTQTGSTPSSRSSSVTSLQDLQSTSNTSSSAKSQIHSKNQNSTNEGIDSTAQRPRSHDDDSPDDTSSATMNSEKVDFELYTINSNYEKINPSITNEQNEMPLINEQSKSLLSPITSLIENIDQEMMNNERMQSDDDDHDENTNQITTTDELLFGKYQYCTNSHDSLLQSDPHLDTAKSSTDDLTRSNRLLTSTFHSKDSALGSSDDNLNRPQSNKLLTSHDEDDQPQQISSSFLTHQNKTIDRSEIIDNANRNMEDETMRKNGSMISELIEQNKSKRRTISSSSSEQLIPKERQTGMYYKAFGSSAAIHLAEQYHCEWSQNIPTVPTIDKSFEIDDRYLRIVHQSQSLDDNEDEFYFSSQNLLLSYSCPNLYPKTYEHLRQRSYSSSTLYAYTYLNITHETLEQIWFSLLNVAFSDKDDYDLSEYRLRHIKGLSSSYSNMNQSVIEKSRSHNDIFSIINKKNQELITKIKSKSFDMTSLMKHSLTTNDSANVGLLQGADITEPFADHYISTSIHSDIESIQSIEYEQIPNVNPPSPIIVKEPLNYVFNYSQQTDNEEYDFNGTYDKEDEPLSISVTFDNNQSPSVIQIKNTYTELSLFRPHSLSTIPSSRASQYASSVDSDDVSEREHHLNKDENKDYLEDNYQYHISDDEHGVIESEFSSPQSRPLSSIQSRPLTPEHSQKSKFNNFSAVEHDTWEQCINEPIVYEDSSNNLTRIVPSQLIDHSQSYSIDQIEPTTVSNENNLDTKNFIQEIDQNLFYSSTEQESDKHTKLDANELAYHLSQLDSFKKTSVVDEQKKSFNLHIIDNKEHNEILISSLDDKQHPTSNIENLMSIVEETHKLTSIQDNHPQTSIVKFIPNSSFTTNRRNEQLKYYQTQRIDKVSDLEIVKQGKGFKIGYTDRQGTAQRVIITKRIEIGPDIMERDPHVRLPHKHRRILNQMYSSVIYTNGYDSMQEDEKFQHSADDIEIPVIGTNPKHFDESDMISIDIDGPSTMLDSICESLVITQGSVYSNTSSNSQFDKSSHHILDENTEHLELISTKKEKIEVIDSWHDHTIINGTSTTWRSPLKTTKLIQPSTNIISIDNSDLKKSTRDIALSPILFPSENQHRTISTSPITILEKVDSSCQYSPPIQHDQDLQCFFPTITSYTQVSSCDIPGLLITEGGTQTTINSSRTNSAFQTYSNSMINQLTTLERSADSGILLDDNLPRKSHLALQVDLKSSSSDSEDMFEVTHRPLIRPTPIYETKTLLNISTTEIEQEIEQLRRERTHILDLLSLNWNRSNIWVELTEAKLNYIIGETDALLRSFSFDTTPLDSEIVKTKMHKYEDDMAELTRQRLAVYRERLEDSKKQLDIKIDELELKKSSIENNTRNYMSASSSYSNFEQIPLRLINKRSKSFLSNSAENLTNKPMQDTIASHPHLLDVSFLTSTPSRITDRPSRFSGDEETCRMIYQRTPRHFNPNNQHPIKIQDQNNGNLSKMEGLSKSQQAILDETDELVKDSQQLHTESASQFERARESLLSSETSIRLARANMAASRLSPNSENKNYLPNDITLAELFKYEQSLAKEAGRNHPHIYSSTKTTTTES